MANWTRTQLLIALNLYCKLPFGKFHKTNPQIVATAEKIGRTPSALAMKLSNFASLDPIFIASGRKGLESASAADREIWDEFLAYPNDIGLASQEAFDAIAAADARLSELSSNSEIEVVPSYFAETTTATVVVRRKQSFFRKAVLSSYESRCCMSGISHPKLLIASHIVPWSKDEHNRLNPANGLCLSALHDKAFDQGLITVLPDLTIRVSEALQDSESSSDSHALLLALHGKPITPPQKLAPSTDFLDYHNKHIFLGV